MQHREWTADDAAEAIRAPVAGDDKYSRGVLGVVTGSALYPGAAVLGVEAALRTGVGMVRYRGADRPADLVLRRRPEAVTAPGRVQAWLLGSGIDAGELDEVTRDRLADAVAEGLPTVLDAGALGRVHEATGPTVITPHHRELATLLGADATAVTEDPRAWCSEAAAELDCVVLLKGSTTHVATPAGEVWVTGPATPWLATAGTGDALGGILGALIATNVRDGVLDESDLARLAASAAVIHALAATRASSGGPFTVLDLAGALPATIADLLRRRT